MNKSDQEFIYNLLPTWVKEVPKGADPTMYGTLTEEGDNKVQERVNSLLTDTKAVSLNSDALKQEIEEAISSIFGSDQIIHSISQFTAGFVVGRCQSIVELLVEYRDAVEDYEHPDDYRKKLAEYSDKIDELIQP